MRTTCGVRCAACGVRRTLVRAANVVAWILLFIMSPPSPSCQAAEGADPAATVAPESPAKASGCVQYSDGTVVEGTVALTQAVQVHDGKTNRDIPAAQVREIRLSPESEEMVRQWRFIEPGQPKKEYIGEPYPVRHLVATVITMAGEELTGHLYTTVVYVSPADRPDDRDRLVLPAKQQGKPGDTLAAVVYPVRIAISHALDAAAEASGTTLRLRGGNAVAKPEVVLIARESLARTEAAPLVDAGSYRLAAPVSPPIFLAARAGAAIEVAWPAAADPAVAKLVAGAVTDAQDFLDQRTVLGTLADGEEQVYALLMLRRVGPTTLEGDKKPWRLEVWRWKRDPASDRLLWAGRSYFFRGNVANGADLPSVHVNQAWWTQKASAGTCEVGDER